MNNSTMLRTSMRRLRSACALVVLALIATSCYSLDSSLVVNEDGSGSFTVEYIINKDTTAASLAAGDLIAACDAVLVMQNAAPAGAVFTPLDSSSQCGARLTIDFANEVELSEGLTVLAARSRFAGFGYFPSLSIQRGDVDGSWNFQGQFKPPLPANLDTQTEFRSEVATGTFVIKVDLPGRQVEHNADRIDEAGLMIFEINPLVDPSGQFFVQTEPGAKILGTPEESSLPWKGIAFVFVALLAAVAGYFILQRAKKRRQFEGEDDNGPMISASERLGLGSNSAAMDPTDIHPETAGVEPAEIPQPIEASVPAAPLVAPTEAGQGVSSGLPFLQSSGEDLWPTEQAAAPTSPVFEAAHEPAEPTSWVSAAQSMDPAPAVAPEPLVTQQPGAMADWPGAPIGSTGVEPHTPGFGETDAFAPEPATDGWPSAQPVASGMPMVENAGGANPVGFDSSMGAAFPEPQTASPAAPQAAVASPLQIPAAEVEGWPSPVANPTPLVADSVPVEPVSGAVAAGTDDAAIGATPSQADMQWDPDRETYVVYDPRRASWMAFDDLTQAWQPIS